MSKGLLLIVDDESRVLRSLKAVFRSTYQVKTTSDCQEALQIIRDNPVNTIISDQRMPEMRGVDLLNKVKEISPNTMRLLLTGYSDIPSILDAINEGEVYRYITKPWGQDEIQTVISDAMQISKKLFHADQVPSYDGSAVSSQTAETGKTELLVLDTQKVIFDMVNKLFSNSCVVHYSNTIDASTEVFARRPVKVVVVNVPKGDADYLSFLKLIKSEYPQIVTIAVMAENDADDIINLINQGQIYRYIPVTVPAGRTRICIQSAIKYANRLNMNPVLAERHGVAKNTTMDSIGVENKSRIIKSMSLLKKRLFGLRAQI
jgi:DNA-binding NtrC family response regulator